MFDGHLPDRGRAGRLRRARSRRAAHAARRRSRTRCRPIAAAGAVRPARPRCAPRCRSPAPRAGFRAGATTSTAEQPPADAMPPARSCPTLLTALHRLGQGLDAGRRRATTSPYAANYLYMLTGEEPDPEPRARRRAVPDLHRRPRLQRLHLHRPGHRLHRRRPGGRPGRRDRRAVRAAARRRAEPGAGHARRDRHPGPRPTLVRERVAARRPDHGLRPPRLPHRGPALACCCARSPSALGGDLVELRRAGRGDASSACSPS